MDIKKNTTKESGKATGGIFSRPSQGGCPSKSTSMCEKHLPGIVTETCGACWLIHSPLGQRNPKPTSHTGHVFSASEK